jgi:hypothetical protein
MFKASWLIVGALLVQAAPVLAESRTFDLAPFDEVEITSGVIGIVRSGVAQSVEAEAANAAVLNRLHVEVRGGRLEVGIDWNLLDYLFTFGQHPPITVRIAAPALRSVDASSGANVDVGGLTGAVSLGASSGASLDAGDVAATEVTVEASSGGGVTVAGTCDRIVAGVSSGGHVSARDLHCPIADAEASSGGQLDIWASQEVEADASSGGHVAVYGSPARTDLESSSGGSTDIIH